MLKWRCQTVDVEAPVAVVADDQLYVIIVIVFVANLAGHVFQTLVPLLGTDVGWSKTEVTFAFLRPTETFCERRAIDIELIVKCKLFIFFNIAQSKDSDANFSKDIPLLGDAVRFARVVDETSQVSLIGRVDNLSF